MQELSGRLRRSYKYSTIEQKKGNGLCITQWIGTVKVPLSQPCFDHFLGLCFRGHDEAGLLAFEALQGLPRPARGTRTKRGSRGLESIILLLGSLSNG